MKGKWLERFEGIGLLLILASVFIQQVEFRLSEEIHKMEMLELHKKIDTLWKLNADIFSHSSSNNSQTKVELNFPLAVATWTDSNNLIIHESVAEKQLFIFKWTAFCLFILGSVFVIIPKFRRKPQTKTDEN